MKVIISFSILLYTLNSCETSIESNNHEKPLIVKKLKTEIETENLPKQNLISRIDSLLLDPFDLVKFKKKKRGANSGGGGRHEDFFYRPDIEGMYYSYFLFGGGRSEGYLGKDKSNKVRLFNSKEIRVYKPKDEDWTMYNDPNEILIEYEAICNDEDLPELAFVGWTKSEIIEELGTPDFIKNQSLVYTHEQRSLILHLLGTKVDWLKYNRLNVDLDSSLNMPNLYKLDMFQF